MKQLRILIAGMVIALTSITSVADEIPIHILNKLKPILPDITLSDISKSPVEGIYEVVSGFNLYFVSADGDYILDGQIIHIPTRSAVVRSSVNDKRKQYIDSVKRDDTVFYPAQKAKRQTYISVFTDITCPYCRKLHEEITELSRAGIEVRYLAFPRAGVPSTAADQLVSVWCADDKQIAMTDAKFGKSVPERTCDNPVNEHYELGKTLGIGGTPAIILESGELISGYVNARALIEKAFTSVEN